MTIPFLYHTLSTLQFLHSVSLKQKKIDFKKGKNYFLRKAGGFHENFRKICWEFVKRFRMNDLDKIRFLEKARLLKGKIY